MNKTQVVNCTENLIYCLGKHNILQWNRIELLNTAIDLEQVSPENWKQEVLSMLPLWRHLHNKYTTVP